MSRFQFGAVAVPLAGEFAKLAGIVQHVETIEETTEGGDPVTVELVHLEIKGVKDDQPVDVLEIFNADELEHGE
jgi:hypothetical protein